MKEENVGWKWDSSFSSPLFHYLSLVVAACFFSRLNCIPMTSICRCFHSFGVIKEGRKIKTYAQEEVEGVYRSPEKALLGEILMKVVEQCDFEN